MCNCYYWWYTLRFYLYLCWGLISKQQPILFLFSYYYLSTLQPNWIPHLTARLITSQLTARFLKDFISIHLKVFSSHQRSLYINYKLSIIIFTSGGTFKLVHILILNAVELLVDQLLNQIAYKQVLSKVLTFRLGHFFFLLVLHDLLLADI